jgi:competence protein ComEC
VRLKHPHGLRNPGDYDFEGKLFDEGIGATGYVVRCECNELIDPAIWRAPVLRAREGVARAIARALPASPYVGILQDLAVGVDDQVPREQWQVFAATGTSHLMAISGFHVAGVALLAMWVVRWLWRFVGVPGAARADIESIVGLLCALAYAFLAGFSVPTQRTLVTLAVVLGARVVRRATSIWDLLGLALIAVLLLDPLATLTAGFWLSFGTVAGILYALEGRLGARSEWRDLLPAQAAATLCLLPLTLAIFGTISLLGPLINLIAIPFFGLVLVPAILIGVALLALPLPFAEHWFQWLDHLVGICWPAFAGLATSPLALVHVAHLPLWVLASLTIAVLWMAAPWPWIVRALGLALALPALLWHEDVLPPGAFEVTVFDVGQGLAVLVSTRSHALLFDTGPAARSGRAAADFSIVPYLAWQGRRDLDAIVLSHSDRDHIGGLDAVTAAVTVDRLYVGGDLRGRRARSCVAGDAWDWDRVNFHFLHPPPAGLEGKPLSDNNGSCVLEVSALGGAVLLTGDIEATAERMLMASNLLKPVDLAVMPHHGSRTSSSVDLVARLAPRWAAVAAGYDNRWHFPKPEVIERWRAAGARTIETARSGAVTFRFLPMTRAAEPTEYRDNARRFWHSD